MTTKQQQRKTAARKARQRAALLALKRLYPQNAFVRAPLGTPVPIRDVGDLNERSKQRLVEGYKRLGPQ